jgi:hypothetical protein
VVSYLTEGTGLEPGLTHYTLLENCDMRFGAFGIDKDGDILFSHAIVGSTCDKDELKASVFAVSRVADCPRPDPPPGAEIDPAPFANLAGGANAGKRAPDSRHVPARSPSSRS